MNRLETGAGGVYSRQLATATAQLFPQRRHRVWREVGRGIGEDLLNIRTQLLDRVEPDELAEFDCAPGCDDVEVSAIFGEVELPRVRSLVIRAKRIGVAGVCDAELRSVLLLTTTTFVPSSSVCSTSGSSGLSFVFS